MLGKASGRVVECGDQARRRPEGDHAARVDRIGPAGAWISPHARCLGTHCKSSETAQLDRLAVSKRQADLLDRHLDNVLGFAATEMSGASINCFEEIRPRRRFVRHSYYGCPRPTFVTGMPCRASGLMGPKKIAPRAKARSPILGSSPKTLYSSLFRLRIGPTTMIVARDKLVTANESIIAGFRPRQLNLIPIADHGHSRHDD